MLFNPDLGRLQNNILLELSQLCEIPEACPIVFDHIREHFNFDIILVTLEIGKFTAGMMYYIRRLTSRSSSIMEKLGNQQPVFFHWKPMQDILHLLIALDC